MNWDSLDDIIQCCSICNCSYDQKTSKQRPYVLKCGHTFCGGCLEPDQTKCYTCRIVHKKPAVVNFQLEEQIKAISDFIEVQKCNQLQPLTNMVLCLDCKIPLMKSDSSTLNLLHDGHEVVNCHSAGESQLKLVFWLVDLFNRGVNAHTKFEKTLQSILCVAQEYQTGLEIFRQASKEPKYEQNFTDSLKSLLSPSQGRQQPEPEFISHLKKMLTIEASLSSTIHKLAHKCTTRNQTEIFSGDAESYSDLFTDLCKDAKKGLYIQPTKKQLTLLPELTLRVEENDRGCVGGYGRDDRPLRRGGYRGGYDRDRDRDRDGPTPTRGVGF